MEKKTATSRPVLGKGLASLLPGAVSPQNTQNLASAAVAPQQVTVSPQMSDSPVVAEIESIRVNPFQPRREFDATAIEDLSRSILTNGVIQPLIVRKTSNGLELIAGERRLRAAKLAGLKQVPVVVRKSTDKESFEIALIENIQRMDLNCIEEALAYQQLSEEFSLTQDEIAHRVGKNRATVANSLRLLQLPSGILDDLKKGTLSLGHGKALLAVATTEARLRLAEKIKKEGLSVRQTEKISQGGEVSATTPASATTDNQLSRTESRLDQIVKDLTRRTTTKVQIKGNDKRGKIVFQYRNADDFERLLQIFQRNG